MKYLIRFITQNAAGGVEHRDKTVDAPAITIGRATDQVLHLRDRRARLQHATIEQQSDGVHISSSAFTGVIVNGRSQRDSRLSIGDTIEVGANILRVIDAPDGVDFAITFELSSEASSDHFVTDWSEPASGLGGWSKRRLSWTLVIVIALFGLALPVFLYEDFMLAGPIHSAHSSTAAECDNCHSAAFARVPDLACEACHTVDRHVVRSTATVLGEIRCASCHLEHNEPQQLVNQHQGLCSNCHANTPPDTTLDAAGDFLDDHPDFELDPSGQDSKLIFNHSVHLDESGIVTPEGRRVIECGECHVPEPGGAGMLAVSMDEHCSSCHALSFDPDDPSRAVPHGDPDTVVQSLIEYYSARLLGGDPDAVEQRLRRPGQALTRAERDRAAAEARVQALDVAEDLFERRACTTCHTVTRLDSGADVPWHVEPVELTQSFFVNANFTHEAHQTEVTSCDGCHDAAASELSQDSLIPGIANCRDCHGSGFANRNSSAQSPSTCVMCHSFHFEAKGPRE